MSRKQQRHVLAVYLASDEPGAVHLAALHAQAARENKTLSGWARGVLLKAAGARGSTLEERVEALERRLEEIDDLDSRVDSLEGTVSDLEESVTALQGDAPG